MKNLRASLDIYFRNINPDKVIKITLKGEWEKYEFNRESFLQNAKSSLDYSSNNEISNLFDKIKEDWSRDTKEKKSQERRIFNLLYQFTHQVLVDESGDPKVNYKHLLRWRISSNKLGEDLFTTNFFAHKDLKYNNKRTYFSWRPVIESNNNHIKQLLSKGLAENHFHLKGSAPHSQLSWIAIMNDIENRLPQFRQLFKDGLLDGGSREEDAEKLQLYFYVIKAAIIRAKLFSLLIDIDHIFTDNDDVSYLQTILKNDSTKDESHEMVSQIQHVQNKINLLKFQFGCPIRTNKGIYRPDYTIVKKLSLNDKNYNSDNFILCGERYFLYNCFRSFKENSKNHKLYKYRGLFYAYLLIKEKFRPEIIQLNERVGFDNFDLYQSRKEIFLYDNFFTKNLINSFAVKTSQSNQYINTLESRISPKTTVPRLESALREASQPFINHKANCKQLPPKIAKFIENNHPACYSHSEYSDSNYKRKNNPEHFHVLHFIKTKDRSYFKSSIIGLVKPRDAGLRGIIKSQALAIAELRNKGNEIAEKIYGIDAAASEFDARPEVFACAYRFLKNHRPKTRRNPFLYNNNIPKLRATYHAGEDFYDIADGIRTIDEAIKFLELEHGDRIGHALALGINPKEYYSVKRHQILVPKHILLDNYAWMISRLTKYGMNEYSSLQGSLIKMFNILFHEIYGHLQKLECDHVSYYHAWSLRGDDPYLYASGEYKEKLCLTEYDNALIGTKYPRDSFRHDHKMQQLYIAYHFDPEAKEKGAKNDVFIVENKYIEAMGIIQRYMQQELRDRHISIECNPSSNVLIGTFKRYDKHPILNFYNLGLTYEPNELNKCPQLIVSINTDDQGVFNTYLENEYALMALALEKAKDKDGNSKYNTAMIYDWLERVRKMGVDMSFSKKN